MNELEEGLKLNIQYKKRGGFVPVIVQDYSSGEILMLGYANQEALEKTLDTGYATFYSTSRNKLWTKGETSGDLLRIKEILVDCDQDALIYKVEMIGEGACHTVDSSGKHRKTCFYRRIGKTKELEFLEGFE